MSWSFNGLPLHPLFVHAVVMLVPIATVAAIVGSLWPAARRKLGIVTPLLTLAAAASAAFTMQAGEWLEGQVKETPLVEAHTDGAEAVPPWIIFMVAAVVAQWLWFRLQEKTKAAGAAPRFTPAVSRAASWALATLVIVSSLGATAIIAIVGDAGARAVWDGVIH